MISLKIKSNSVIYTKNQQFEKNRYFNDLHNIQQTYHLYGDFRAIKVFVKSKNIIFKY